MSEIKEKEKEKEKKWWYLTVTLLKKKLNEPVAPVVV